MVEKKNILCFAKENTKKTFWKKEEYALLCQICLVPKMTILCTADVRE